MSFKKKLIGQQTGIVGGIIFPLHNKLTFIYVGDPSKFCKFKFIPFDMHRVLNKMYPVKQSVAHNLAETL